MGEAGLYIEEDTEVAEEDTEAAAEGDTEAAAEGDTEEDIEAVDTSAAAEDMKEDLA